MFCRCGNSAYLCTTNYILSFLQFVTPLSATDYRHPPFKGYKRSLSRTWGVFSCIQSRGAASLPLGNSGLLMQKGGVTK